MGDSSSDKDDEAGSSDGHSGSDIDRHALSGVLERKPLQRTSRDEPIQSSRGRSRSRRRDRKAHMLCFGCDQTESIYKNVKKKPFCYRCYVKVRSQRYALKDGDALHKHDDCMHTQPVKWKTHFKSVPQVSPGKRRTSACSSLRANSSVSHPPGLFFFGRNSSRRVEIQNQRVDSPGRRTDSICCHTATTLGEHADRHVSSSSSSHRTASDANTSYSGVRVWCEQNKYVHDCTLSAN